MFSNEQWRLAGMPFCRNCGAQYSEGTRFCSNCGAALEAAAPPTTYHVTPGMSGITISTLPRKDTGITALIAGLGGIFLFGLGHFYVGKIGRGILFLLVGIVLKVALLVSYLGGIVSLFTGTSEWFGILILVAVLNLGLWIWQIYDPYKLAKTYNAEVERTGKPPW
jgi:TM2 domain-containing membrane protein YozV